MGPRCGRISRVREYSHGSRKVATAAYRCALSAQTLPVWTEGCLMGFVVCCGDRLLCRIDGPASILSMELRLELLDRMPCSGRVIGARTWASVPPQFLAHFADAGCAATGSCRSDAPPESLPEPRIDRRGPIAPRRCFLQCEPLDAEQVSAASDVWRVDPRAVWRDPPSTFVHSAAVWRRIGRSVKPPSPGRVPRHVHGAFERPASLERGAGREVRQRGRAGARPRASG
jgi:hypothetical protein